MTQSKYSFVRTELRVLQNTCNGDNEKFLNLLSDNIGSRDEKIEELKLKLSMAEHRVRVLEQRSAEQSWRDNPDRSGGQFTQDEINRASEWR